MNIAILKTQANSTSSSFNKDIAFEFTWRKEKLSTTKNN